MREVKKKKKKGGGKKRKTNKQIHVCVFPPLEGGKLSRTAARERTHAHKKENQASASTRQASCELFATLNLDMVHLRGC